MLVVNRFRSAEPAFGEEVAAALEVLAARTGFEDGRIARNLDEPDLWVLVTQWRDVGSYRRALSSYDVKVGVVPLLSRALDEPSAYEELSADMNRSSPRELR